VAPGPSQRTCARALWGTWRHRSDGDEYHL